MGGKNVTGVPPMTTSTIFAPDSPAGGQRALIVETISGSDGRILSGVQGRPYPVAG